MRFIKQVAGLKGIDWHPSGDERLERENDWVRGLNRGEAQSFEKIYRYYYPRLGQFLMRYVHSKQVAEDLVHQVFFAVWKNRTRLEPKGTLRAYLYTAVRNQALKYLDKENSRQHIELGDHPELQARKFDREEHIEYKEFSRAVQAAIGQMPTRRRHIFLMHREDGLTYREIAEVLGISIKTVETQMRRSLKFLQHKLSHFRD